MRQALNRLPASVVLLGIAVPGVVHRRRSVRQPDRECTSSRRVHQGPISGLGCLHAREWAIVALRFVPLLLLTAIPAASGAELVPYSLPSQQRVSPTATPLPDRQAVRPVISESYYDQFAARAKALKAEQRVNLRSSLERKLDQAIAAQQVDEVRHYRRLVQILDSLN